MASTVASMVAAPTCSAVSRSLSRANAGRCAALCRQQPVFSTCTVDSRIVSVPSMRPQQRPTSALHAVPVELFQLAEEGGFIWGTAATMAGMTLLGLAIGFVLLRVEALVEEGKI